MEMDDINTLMTLFVFIVVLDELFERIILMNMPECGIVHKKRGKAFVLSVALYSSFVGLCVATIFHRCLACWK